MKTADSSEAITITAYRGAGSDDEIRRHVERDGAVVEGGTAYCGSGEQQWLREQRSVYLAPSRVMAMRIYDRLGI